MEGGDLVRVAGAGAGEGVEFDLLELRDCVWACVVEHVVRSEDAERVLLRVAFRFDSLVDAPQLRGEAAGCEERLQCLKQPDFVARSCCVELVEGFG